MPASVASAPEARMPEINAEASISPVRRGSRPTIVDPYADPRTLPTESAKSGVTSTLATPRIPEEPNSRTLGQPPRLSKSFAIGTLGPSDARASDAPNYYIPTFECAAIFPQGERGGTSYGDGTD